MKSWLAIVLTLSLATGVLLASSETAAAIVAQEIEDATDDLRRKTRSGQASSNDAEVQRLEAALEQGQRASAGLRTGIAELQKEKEALEEQKRALERVQVVLASGLIGALVTALVAILGTILNVRRSRTDRDLRRLEVLQKSHELQDRGIPVPRDILETYEARTPPG